jgi:hypothetical protein
VALAAEAVKGTILIDEPGVRDYFIAVTAFPGSEKSVTLEGHTGTSRIENNSEAAITLFHVLRDLCG